MDLDPVAGKGYQNLPERRFQEGNSDMTIGLGPKPGSRPNTGETTERADCVGDWEKPYTSKSNGQSR